MKKKGAYLSHCWEDEICNGDHSSLLMGAAIGAVIAGIAALLLAPDSGRKIRKLLGDQYGVSGEGKRFHIDHRIQRKTGDQ